MYGFHLPSLFWIQVQLASHAWNTRTCTLAVPWEIPFSHSQGSKVQSYICSGTRPRAVGMYSLCLRVELKEFGLHISRVLAARQCWSPADFSLFRTTRPLTCPLGTPPASSFSVSCPTIPWELALLTHPKWSGSLFAWYSPCWRWPFSSTNWIHLSRNINLQWPWGRGWRLLPDTLNSPK